MMSSNDNTKHNTNGSQLKTSMLTTTTTSDQIRPPIGATSDSTKLCNNNKVIDSRSDPNNSYTTFTDNKHYNSGDRRRPPPPPHNRPNNDYYYYNSCNNHNRYYDRNRRPDGMSGNRYSSNDYNHRRHRNEGYNRTSDKSWDKRCSDKSEVKCEPKSESSNDFGAKSCHSKDASNHYYKSNDRHSEQRRVRTYERSAKNGSRVTNDYYRSGGNDRPKRFNETSDKSKAIENESNGDVNSNDKTCCDDNLTDESTNSVDEYLQLKLDELTALKSIFDENVLTIDEMGLKGRFLAEPVLNTNGLTVFYETYNQRRYDRQSDDKCKTEEFLVQHLPPIELYFELPKRYPLKSNPKFLVSCKWLGITKIEIICHKLESLWKECQMEVLYTWFSFLQNDVIDHLRIGHRLDITYIISNNPKWITNSDFESKPNQIKDLTTLSKSKATSGSDRYSTRDVIEFKPSLSYGRAKYDRRAACDLMGKQLITYLMDYNEHKRNDTFNKSYILCNICFSSHMGEECVVFTCLHIFCKTCIANYFKTLINEGTVNQLKCPDTDCQTQAPPNMIRDLVSEELFKKYDKLMLETLIGSMSDVYYCPRKTCGTVVIGDADSSLAHCSACGYAFCKNCKFTYHGFDPCTMFRDAQQRKLILDKYCNATAEEKLALEKIYGKKQISSALEEAATDKWLEDMSKRCPHCKALIEKSDGCNKMACWRCNTFFCWLCLAQLPLTQPYAHFSNPASKCYNQLFRGANFDIDDMFEDFEI